MNKKVSLKDVAARVGVSATLVSYVLNGKEEQGRVGKEMAAKIRKAAKAMNYQPNFIARSLKFGRTRTLGLIVADISNPFFSNLARIIENEAKRHGYTVIFGSSNEDPEKFRDLVTAFINRQVDGLILAAAEGSAPDIKRLKKQGVHFVLVDRYFPNIDANAVSINNYDAAFAATEHLIKSGYKRPGLIAYDSKLEHMQQRMLGYKDALAKSRIKERKLLITANTEDVSGQVEAAVTHLIEKEKADAILFATISLATRSLYVIRNKNYRVPDELGLISFDESDVFDFFHRPLSYIRQDLKEIGEQSVNILVQQIENTENKKTLKAEVPTELVVRESSQKGKLFS